MNSGKISPVFRPYHEEGIKPCKVNLSKMEIEEILISDSEEEEEEEEVVDKLEEEEEVVDKLEKQFEKSLDLKSVRNSPKKKILPIKNEQSNNNVKKNNRPKKFKPTSEWVASLMDSDEDESSDERPATPIRLKICRTNRETTPNKKPASFCDSPNTQLRESKRKLKPKPLDYDDIVKNQFSPSPPKHMNIKLLKEQHISENKSPKSKNIKSKIKNNSPKKTPKSKNKLKKKSKDFELEEKVVEILDEHSKSPTKVVNTPKKKNMCEDLVQELLKSRKSTILSQSNFENIEIESIETETPSMKMKKKLFKEEENISKNINNSSKKENKIKSDNKINEIKPKIENLLNKDCEVLQEVRQRLHVATTPETLPCREREFSNIYTFIKNKLIDGVGGCMYISGVPGTGKTATVHAVVRNLQKEMKNEDVPKFKYVEINGLHLIKPQQAYKYLLIGLEGESAKKFSCEEAKEKLERRFNGKTKMATLVLVDELDQLCTRRQDLIYTLLDWPRRANSQLLVITVANTMDLPERLLMGRVASRLGLTRLTFQPYSFKQLMEIVTQRLIGFETSFDPDGAQLIARKVASLSGDARRALDLFRRAAEIAKNRVEMQHVNAALEEMLTSPKIKTILSCSYLEILFLRAIVYEIQRTGVDETIFDKVYQQLCLLSNIEGLQEPSLSAGLRICQSLSESRLLLTEKTRVELYKKILLNVNIDELHYALKSITLPSEKI